VVNKAKYPDKKKARAALEQMEKQVKADTPLADVAKQGFDDVAAAKGSLHDWVSKGCLADAAIEQAVFQPAHRTTQPDHRNVGRIYDSPRHRSSRSENGRFSAIQDKIRKRITDERTDRQFREYLDRLKKEDAHQYDL